VLTVDPPATSQPSNAARLLLDGMKSWINSPQLYRHSQDQQEPAEPSADFVVAHMSAGASRLQCVIELWMDEN
jgi:hypothetical protein